MYSRYANEQHVLNSPNKRSFVYTILLAFIENESTHNLSKHIQNALAALPKRQKEIIYLRFFQNLDREHIAQVMDITPQTVSNILQIAFKGIRKNWKNAYLAFFLLHFLFN